MAASQSRRILVIGGLTAVYFVAGRFGLSLRIHQRERHRRVASHRHCDCCASVDRHFHVAGHRCRFLSRQSDNLRRGGIVGRHCRRQHRRGSDSRLAGAAIRARAIGVRATARCRTVRAPCGDGSNDDCRKRRYRFARCGGSGAVARRPVNLAHMVAGRHGGRLAGAAPRTPVATGISRAVDRRQGYRSSGPCRMPPDRVLAGVRRPQPCGRRISARVFHRAVSPMGGFSIRRIRNRRQRSDRVRRCYRRHAARSRSLCASVAERVAASAPGFRRCHDDGDVGCRCRGVETTCRRGGEPVAQRRAREADCGGTGGASRCRGRQQGQGALSGYAVARASDTAQRGPRLGARPARSASR